MDGIASWQRADREWGAALLTQFRCNGVITALVHAGDTTPELVVRVVREFVQAFERGDSTALLTASQHVLDAGVWDAVKEFGPNKVIDAAKRLERQAHAA